MRRALKRSWSICIGAAQASVVLLAVGCTTTITEAKFMKTEAAMYPTRSARSELSLEPIQVEHRDGVVTRGVRMTVAGAQRTVLFFLGNGESVDVDAPARLSEFERLGLNAVVLDRRGSGASGGMSPDARLLREDALETFDQIREETHGTLILHGFSLGSSEASAVAGEREVDGLVLEGSMATISQYVDAHIAYIAKASLGLRVSASLESISPALLLHEFPGPLLVAVGADDTNTDPRLSRELFERAKTAKKMLVIVPDASHHALLSAQGFEAYRTFLQVL